MFSYAEELLNLIVNNIRPLQREGCLWFYTTSFGLSDKPKFALGKNVNDGVRYPWRISVYLPEMLRFLFHKFSLTTDQGIFCFDFVFNFLGYFFLPHCSKSLCQHRAQSSEIYSIPWSSPLCVPALMEAFLWKSKHCSHYSYNTPSKSQKYFVWKDELVYKVSYKYIGKRM